MREVRTAGEIVRRAAGEAETRRIEGYAAVFDRETNIADIFVERIAPGAFRAAIGRDDVRCLFNHNDNQVIGRTASGTLQLAEDDHGLRFEAEPPDAEWARGLVASIERGDISGCSFAFRATKEQWDDPADGLPVRTILEATLFDVGPVTFPAYDDTEVGVRARSMLVEARSAGLIKPAIRPLSAADDLLMRVELDLRARQISRL